MKSLLPALLLAATASAAPVFTTEKTDSEIRILADGKLACAYVFRGAEKPYVYPLTAPDGVTLNREFPMREVAGESHDHLHHRSLWFTHGDVNGVDFWSVAKGAGTIQVEGTPEAAVRDNVAQVRAHCRWVAPDGKVIARDETALSFGALPGGERFIDVRIAMRGEGGPLVFGDTKEGSMGLRLLDAFNFKNAATVARNSEGDGNKTIWGRRARWVDYGTECGGGWHGVAVFNHPDNPLSPPRWHARDYGLLAVNPFGEKSFDKKSGQAGGFTLPPGGEAVWRYRFVFYAGRKNADDVEKLAKSYAAPKGDT